MEIRIIELPQVKMARSGDKDLRIFEEWWSTISSKENGVLFPQDFVWNNQKLGGQLEWLYVIPDGITDTNEYEVFDFPGGLYAVATSYDEDEAKTKAYFMIKEWVEKSEYFELANETNDSNYHNRYGMGHVITPDGLPVKNQFDMFIPIVLKKENV